MDKFSVLPLLLLCCHNVFLISVLSNVATADTNDLNCTAILEEKAAARASGSQKPEEIMASNDSVDPKTATSIYDFTVKDTYGNDVSLEKYRGNVVLIVNIASQCGLTKNNYAKLTQLHKEYYDKGLRILSFPCNQFSSQMPEDDGDEMVCHLKSKNAEVGDVFAKVDVNGENAIPLYKYLKAKQNGFVTDSIKWNFTKFLVDKNGQPVGRFSPTTDPMGMVKEIEKLL